MTHDEPTIVAFLCNWCTFTAADLAGTSRTNYPQNVRIVRVMCSGMVDPMYVLKAFIQGADGVLVGGCWPGDCHYINGNLKARRRMALLKNLLATFGIGEERLWLKWIAASEGIMFAETISEMTDHLRELGPSPLRLSKVA
jgi:coenzyme F420-reducing hydrogenase delta subunit